ncbi:MAG: ATP-binding protein [Planctomycetota bacterium]
MPSIKSRIRGGETAILEYKKTCPTPRKLARVIAAFANGAGGEIVVGISDQAEILGVEDPEAEINSIETALEYLEPKPELKIETVVHELRDLVFVTVAARDDLKFVELFDDNPKKGLVYVRVFSETRPLDRDIVKDAIRLRRRYGGDPRLSADELKLVTWLWTNGEAKEPVCAGKFNFSDRRLRKLAETCIGKGLVIHCRSADGRTYIGLRPGT